MCWCARCPRSTSTSPSSARWSRSHAASRPPWPRPAPAFDKQKELEYSISSITGKDLIITKENDKVVVAYAYDKLVPIWGPVYILIKYEGRSR
jgi:hypothetical protein